MPTINIGKVDINVEQYGEGEPLLLLMGLGGDGALWRPHIDEYQKHFRCFAIDNRGAGRSSKPQGPYTMSMMAEDTLSVMQKLNLAKAHVAGISMGGAIAQELAIMAPERIQTLTLTSTWDRSDDFTVRMFQVLKRIYESMDSLTVNRLLQMMIYVPDYINKHFAELEEHSSHGSRMPVEAFHSQCEACILHNTKERLKYIGAPTLIAAGEHDSMLPPVPMSNALASAIPNSKLEVFEGGGHAFHWEQLERFNRLTLHFMLENRIPA